MKDKLEALMRSTEVTGMAVSCLNADGTSDSFIFGSLGEMQIGEDTTWPVASLTKPVFAYGTMRLVEQGRIDLDRPLQAYLPAPYLADDDFVPQMTARHALSHSTGFPNWRDASGLRAAFVPGTKFSYSSEGLTYLQMVVQHLLGMPLASYLKEQVFTPLAMERTVLKEESRADLPPMLRFLEGSLLANGALSLRTTITDYTRFIAAMLGTGPAGNEMLRPHIPVTSVPGLYWGLGWGVQDTGSIRSFWHWGARSTPNTMSFVMGIPSQQRAIVIFTNHTSGLYLCRSIVELWTGEVAFPAFEWLLPAQEWRPDGKQRA